MISTLRANLTQPQLRSADNSVDITWAIAETNYLSISMLSQNKAAEIESLTGATSFTSPTILLTTTGANRG